MAQIANDFEQINGLFDDTPKMQTELENRGTSVESIEGIRSAHLSGGVGFAWNVGGSIRPLTGGGCAAPLWRLR